jgi:putative ATPase
VASLARENTVLYDKASGRHYDHASAFQKSLRGSDPDAAVYWMAKMLAAGEDPRFVARRLVVTAAEDVGLADPRALTVAVAAFQALEALGMPEARIPLAEAAIYVATAPKSNSAVAAIDAASSAITGGESHEVPPFLRMTAESSEYKSPHGAAGHFLPTDYLPQELRGRAFYIPGELGDERPIAERVRGALGRGRERGEDPGRRPPRPKDETPRQ